jgi:hypothetical protein
MRGSGMRPTRAHEERFKPMSIARQTDETIKLPPRSSTLPRQVRITAMIGSGYFTAQSGEITQKGDG